MLDYDTLHMLKTDDGSVTLADASRTLSLRSLRGAATESRHVFIEGSNIARQRTQWKILELGLGTGMNFCQSVAAYNDSEASSLIYHVVEETPIPPSRLAQLASDAPAALRPGFDVLSEALRRRQDSPNHATITVETPKRICFILHPRRWQEISIPPLDVDAYFHDPFAPAENPTCWTQECFNWASSHLSPEGRLVTYGAASHVRKAMTEAGLFVAKGRGACGKREMTFAARSPKVLAPHKLLPNSKQPKARNPQ